jgi:hypothetical protein
MESAREELAAVLASAMAAQAKGNP